jgi:16S rRNA (guanine527-N7)-methyltransferase
LTLFADRLPLAQAYAGMLATDGIERGLIGPREVPRLWTRHLLNCGVVSDLVDNRLHAVDLGSGAGLPGIVVAILRPDLKLTLLEPLLRRSIFLVDCVERLQLDNVRVVRRRAEDAVGEILTDLVLARAVASLSRLARWAVPLLRDQGELLAIKGANAESELAEAMPALRSLGVVSAEVLRVGETVVVPPTTVVKVRAGRREAERKG